MFGQYTMTNLPKKIIIQKKRIFLFIFFIYFIGYIVKKNITHSLTHPLRTFTHHSCFLSHYFHYHSLTHSFTHSLTLILKTPSSISSFPVIPINPNQSLILASTCSIPHQVIPSNDAKINPFSVFYLYKKIHKYPLICIYKEKN